MPRTTLHKFTKKKHGKKQFPIVKLLLMPFLILLLLLTVFQLQQRQTIKNFADTATCGSPGDKGNEMGVGKYCTEGGGQCLGTGSPICSADIQLNGSGICSKACNTDVDCGTGATCYQDTLGKGCKPDVCTTTPPTATPKPTTQPRPTATPQPTAKPTLKPTSIPTATPTQIPFITAAATAVPTAVPTSTPQATSMIISVYLHGIGNSGDNRNQVSTLSNKTPIHPQRTFTVSIMDAQSQPVSTLTIVFSYDPLKGLYTGTADLGNSVVTGSYGITLKTPSFLKKTVTGISVVRGQQVPVLLSLIAGDVNNDDTLNMLDYNAIVSCLSVLTQPVSCTNTQQQAADLNDDGKVDQTDYNLFLREISVPSQ